MNKFLVLLLLPSLILLSGCNNQKKYEEAISEYATAFYNDYQKGSIGLTNPTISIAQLKEANELVQANYDLSKLDGCEDQSYVELIIDEETQDILEIKYFLQCE